QLEDHPAVDSLFKLFYLSLESISRKWTLTVPNWPSALSHFAIEFKDRMPNNHYHQSAGKSFTRNY
ncbi:MAG: hypothetical protein ACRDBP_12320, partial [Luteolibacter sp.]